VRAACGKGLVSTNKTKKEHRVLTSLSKGLRLLLELGRASKPLRLSDLSREMGSNKATTVRILLTLEQLAFVQRNREDRTYRIGPSAFYVGDGFFSGSKREQIRQIMRRLVTELRQQLL
jgi:DNA-binding IclR family transcriptional regulator